jgi:hypothetical protein
VLATRVGDRARSRMGGLVCLALVVFVLMAGGQNSEGREDSRVRQGFSFASLRSLGKVMLSLSSYPFTSFYSPASGHQ